MRGRAAATGRCRRQLRNFAPAGRQRAAAACPRSEPPPPRSARPCCACWPSCVSRRRAWRRSSRGPSATSFTGEPIRVQGDRTLSAFRAHRAGLCRCDGLLRSLDLLYQLTEAVQSARARIFGRGATSAGPAAALGAELVDLLVLQLEAARAGTFSPAPGALALDLAPRSLTAVLLPGGKQTQSPDSTLEGPAGLLDETIVSVGWLSSASTLFGRFCGVGPSTRGCPSGACRRAAA